MVSLSRLYGLVVFKKMKTILFNNTVLRDGHQSMAATRMTTAQMLPAAPILDGMGFNGLETWGGATIDSRCVS
jgi:pyruvate carboxylase subunit B